MSAPEMPGWETTYMTQNNGYVLKKVLKNIEYLKTVLRPEDSLLDVGCCEGHIYEKLGHANYQGIDLLESNVEKARVNFPGVDFRQGNLFELEGKWDVIFCCRVLMHIPRFEEAIARLKSCARRYVVIAVPIRDEESLETHVVKQGSMYFRIFSEDTVRLGKCEVIRSKKYSTVIYDCTRPYD